MKYLVLLAFIGCTSALGPEPEPEPVCPDGYEEWGWSHMDTLGVLTKKTLCLPEGTADALFKPES